MYDSDDLETRWPWIVGRLVLGGMLVVVVYVLSMGPAYWLEIHHPDYPRTLDTLYAPVDWARRYPPVESVFWPYLRWWIKLPSGKEKR